MKSNDALVRVRYAETDAMGFVYHTNYLVWFEVGRAEYMRAAGIPYAGLEETGLSLPLVECGCRFHHPGRYDDLLTIRTRVAELTRIRVKFGYHVIRSRDGELLAEGFTTHAFTDREGKLTRVRADSDVWQHMQDQIELVVPQ